MDKKALAKDYFERHKSSKECYITSDGRVFHSAGAAESFAGSLKDQSVEKFTPDQVSDDQDDQEVESLLASFNAQSETAAKDAKAIVKALGLKPASNKNADIIAAVVAHIEESKA